MSHARAAMAARLRKEAHPELYCRVRSCLWRLSSGPCRNHGEAPSPKVPFEFTGVCDVCGQPTAGGAPRHAECRLTPLTPVTRDEPVSACAAAIIGVYTRLRAVAAVEADNDAYVALARLGRTEEPTVVEGQRSEP